ncbi:GTPase Era [Pseudoxanthomonas sp. CAU 1598]|uniref:GTPase Era n=1 Tax=Pseudomarimonas arenosa TaxID=2774145 RepID=A0AAW3ZG19_9GAMM|nr:GTPase Era [Pseudomarimonas arenosa]
MAVIGRPNVGKSSIVNALVGFRVSIVSRRPQTTRHRILGIATSEQGQILFADTPGLHAGGKRAINRYMNRAASGALLGVDLALLVVEAGRWREEDQRALNLVRESGLPCILAVNKVDQFKQKADLLPHLKELADKHGFVEIVPMSATKRSGLSALQTSLLKHLPQGEALYEADEVTDRSQRFLAAELVREQLMRQLGDELPYSTTVEIEHFSDEVGMLRISAVVWVERDGQKAIVVGAGGAQARSIGRAARIAMEKLFGRKIFLQIWCKVRENWSDDEASLKKFGYVD